MCYKYTFWDISITKLKGYESFGMVCTPWAAAT